MEKDYEGLAEGQVGRSREFQLGGLLVGRIDFKEMQFYENKFWEMDSKSTVHMQLTTKISRKNINTVQKVEDHWQEVNDKSKNHGKSTKNLPKKK